MVPFQKMVYVEDRDDYMPDDEVPAGAQVLEHLGHRAAPPPARGREIPAWFTYPEVAARAAPHATRRAGSRASRSSSPGLSGAGKSTIANVLLVKFLEMGGRPVTLLDGDIVRKNLSSELGFSQGAPRHQHPPHRLRRLRDHQERRHRDLRADRALRRRAQGGARDGRAGGGFILVHVATPIEVCEERDRKGLYAKARAGHAQGVHRHLRPLRGARDAEVVIDTTRAHPGGGGAEILLHMRKEGYLALEEMGSGKPEATEGMKSMRRSEISSASPRP